MMTTAADVETQKHQVEEQARAAEAAIGPWVAKLPQVPTHPAAVRAHVTMVVVWSFALYAGGVLVFIMLSKDTNSAKFNILIEILKTLLLPIVTFVIGHYFGSKSE
jgi:hypothetical protein